MDKDGPRPYDPVKDPIYQKLLAVQGLGRRAENLLFCETVDTEGLRRALVQLQITASQAVEHFHRWDRWRLWNKKL